MLKIVAKSQTYFIILDTHTTPFRKEKENIGKSEGEITSIPINILADGFQFCLRKYGFELRIEDIHQRLIEIHESLYYLLVPESHHVILLKGYSDMFSFFFIFDLHP